MPIYEFRCPSCGHQFEELVLGRVQVSEIRCPKCLNLGVERLLSVFSSCAAAEGGSQKNGSSACGGSSRFT